MEKGFKLIVYEKPSEYIEFKTPDKNGNCRSIYLNFTTFQPTLSDYSFYRTKRDLENIKEDISLPTKDCLRKHYDIGDKVYIQIFDCGLNVGTIVKKIDNGFGVIINKHHPPVFRLACHMIPYNYYILHANCRAVIKEWLFVACRLKLYKDLRKLIASYIWKSRNEYEWDF